MCLWQYWQLYIQNANDISHKDNRMNYDNHNNRGNNNGRDDNF